MYLINQKTYSTPPRSHFISGLKNYSRNDHFGLKMMVKSGLEFFYFENYRAPSELLLPSAKISAQNGWIGLAA